MQNTEHINGFVYNSRFVNYDDSGKILSISLEKESINNIEIDNDLIPNFISAVKDFNNYNIQYFLKIKQGLISDEDELDTIVKSEYVFHKIVSDEDTYEVLIRHDLKNKKWHVDFSNLILDNSVSNFVFYVTKKSNKNFLISSYNIHDISDSHFEFDFKTIDEEQFSGIEVLVYRKFKYYCLREI